MNEPINEFRTGITLDQWRAVVAVVEKGSFSRAATRLHKTQSTISHAVQELEQRLGVQVFQTVGRRAVLTATGQMLYERARRLLEECARLERTAVNMARGQEAELSVAIEMLYPRERLLECLQRFDFEQPGTRVEVYETLLGGTDELLAEGRVDLAVCSEVPAGFAGDPLRQVRFRAVAAPNHPLLQLKRSLSISDLKSHRHLVVRDSGQRRARPAVWPVAERRLIFSHWTSSVRAACEGLGFAWLADDWIAQELASGALAPLPLTEGSVRWGALFLVYRDPGAMTPGIRCLGELLRAAIAAEHSADNERRDSVG